MKKRFQLLLASIFVEFKWYRKKKGGKWYQIYEKDGFNTIDGASAYWTQSIPVRPHEVLQAEEW